ncbi:MAG: 4-carboxymuconolactone decarboxylase [Candidatus Binatales bacterium]
MPAHRKRSTTRRDAKSKDPKHKDSQYKAGLAVRRRVLGAAHVKRSLRNATTLDQDYQDFITRYAWGGIWTRPGLDKKTRSLLTIAILAALGREEVLRLHVRAVRNTGATPEEVKEALLHVAVYAGVPAADSAFRIAKAVFAEQAGERERS